MKHLIRLLTVFILAITLYSCNKDEQLYTDDEAIAHSRSDAPSSSYKDDIINRPNPFSLENMRLAARELYGNAAKITTTDWYIKFSPETIEEFVALIDSDLEIFDFPMHKDVEEQMTATRREITEQNLGDYYAVIKPNQTTTMPYDHLADLYLTATDQRLVEKAYTRLGYDPVEEGYFYTPMEEANLATEVETYNVDPQRGPTYGDQLIVDSDCECKKGIHKRNPAGCITLEDNLLSNGQCTKAVRHVKIILKNNWFSSAITYTDKFGCFTRDRRYKGSAWMWVEFKNQHVTIRGIEGGFSNFLEYYKPVKDYTGRWKQASMNNMDVCYSYQNTNSGNGYRYWRAAMINNGVFEYRDWSAANDLQAPMADLQVLMTKVTNTGAAPMLDKIGDVSIGPFTEDPESGAVAIGLKDKIGGTLLLKLIETYFPDLVFNTQEVPESDIFKRRIYNQLGKAQHFTTMGFPSDETIDYWLDYLTYLIVNLGLGNATSEDAGRIQIIENWARTVGSTTAHEAYEDNVSIGTTHLCNLESAIIDDLHIQTGWLHDIYDWRTSDCEGERLDDEVGGYPHSNFLNLMNTQMVDPEDFREDFINTFLNPVTLEQFDLLCDQYGIE